MAFVRAVLEHSSANPFLEDFAQFHEPIDRVGRLNSLSQCVLKMTSPGVPDIYQGTELFDFSLVDPDNRRPIDYARRFQMLAELQRDAEPPPNSPCPAPISMTDAQDDKLKLQVTWKTLALRRKESSLFQQGSYISLRVNGEKSAHVVALARRYGGRIAVVAVPRLCATLLSGGTGTVCGSSVWGETNFDVPQSRAECYHNIFTGECLSIKDRGKKPFLKLADVFRFCPVAILLGEEKAS